MMGMSMMSPRHNPSVASVLAVHRSAAESDTERTTRDAIGQHPTA